jgi:hypothetical protein
MDRLEVLYLISLTIARRLGTDKNTVKTRDLACVLLSDETLFILRKKASIFLLKMLCVWNNTREAMIKPESRAVERELVLINY